MSQSKITDPAKRSGNLRPKYAVYKSNILKRLSVAAAMIATSFSAGAQANYWNLGGTYMDCNTGNATTLSGTPYTRYLFESDAASFLIPGLCNTYCKLGFGMPGRATTIVINHITESYVPPIPGFTAGVKQISTSTFYSDDASFAPGQLKPDGTRELYARNGNVIMHMGTLSPTGAVSGSPTILYTAPVPSGVQFDRWTEMEVSSDAKYLLLVGADAKNVCVLNIAAGTADFFAAPGGGYSRIQGIEYVGSWGSKARVYVSYNSKCAANPGGTGGLGYYDIDSGVFTPVTTYPVGTPTDFGFSEIELAKDNKLYIARNASANYNFSNPGTVYSLSPTGIWTTTPFTVPAANNMLYAAECNKYYIQTQIDGENYNLGNYSGPSALYLGTRLNGKLAASAFPNPATPTFYRCGTEPIVLTSQVSGLMDRYVISVTSGTIPAGTTTFVPTSGMTASTTLYGYSNMASASLLSFVPASYIGTDWKIEITPKNECAIGPTLTVYTKVRNASALANYGAPTGIGLTSKPILTSLTFPPAPAVSTNITTFKNNIDATIGWMGAKRAGMTDITTNGNYTIRVYEADAVTGNRKVRSSIEAPDVAYTTGTGNLTGATFFNLFSYTFDPAYPPFYINTPVMNGDSYFEDYYEWAWANGTLSDFSDRVYCAELTVLEPTSGCSTTKKSYFRIANNGASNGKNARPGREPEDDDELNAGLHPGASRSADGMHKAMIGLYPNPASTHVIVKIPFTTTPVNMILTDNTGRKVGEYTTLHGGKNQISLAHLPAGVYFYQVNIDGVLHYGKLAKQ